MDAHLANGPLQAVACSALSMLALNSQEVKAMMEEQQALKRILAAMDSHLEDRQVQGMGCYALMSAANSDTRAQIVKGGGIDLSFTLLQL
jgi:predicted xylose isomerase-like sugar epimerase